MYYVAPTGSDTYPGTQALPFQTIQQAANVVFPGDTVIVEDGVYTDTDGDRIVVKFQRGGTSSAKITFRSEHRWGAKIDGQNNTSRTGIEFGSGADWIRLEGFEIYGVGNNSQTDGASGIVVYNGGSNVEIVGNHIHDIGRACTDTPIGENGMFIGNQSEVLIEGNLIHDVGRFAPGENGCQPTTTNYQNHDHGIYINTANNVTVRNNILYNCKRGWSIQIYPNAVSGILIHNNTFAFENPYRDGQIIVGADCASCQIENNVSYAPHNAFIRFYQGTHTNFIAASNIVYAAGLYSGTAISGVTFASNWPYTDPLMVAPLSYDFHLRTGSPAIDTGLFIPSVVIDFDGVLRPQGAGYDVGAYERIP